MPESKPKDLYPDEGMELLERAMKHGPDRDCSAEEVRAFDNAVKDMLKDIAWHTARRYADHENEKKEDI